MTNAILMAQREPSFLMPEPASTTASDVDTTFYFVFYVSSFFFVLIIGLMFAFVLRYRRRKPGEAAPGQVAHSTPLEIIWSAIPIILVAVMFWLGFKSYMAMRTMPANTYEINVDAKKWRWSFRYPGGIEHEELHVPVDTPVRLVMRSQDVIHSL